MYYNKWNIKRISLWIFVTMQLLFFIIYFTIQNENSTGLTEHNLENSIQFISTKQNNNNTHLNSRNFIYHNDRSIIILPTSLGQNLYVDFNTSLCYKTGTDLSSMQRDKNINWKCLCVTGWHGNDCGQPEVIWRALLTSKKLKNNILGPRKLQRRLIYFLDVQDAISLDFIEITMNEVKDATDLFILYDCNGVSNIRNRLNSGFLKDLHGKILYLTDASKTLAWRKTKLVIRNLRDDDIFFISSPFEVPNVRALTFLKLYNHWPQPLIFRLRWSVYGFFWRHPLKTVLAMGASTINYLYAFLDDNLNRFNYTFRLNEMLKPKQQQQQALIVGDLNHFGGWFCEYCMDSATIMKMLKQKFTNGSTTILEKVVSKKIDTPYIEDLIENGLYVDGKLELQRAYRSHEQYYAPNYVTNNNWKYDWLLVNLYSKLDYY